MAKTKQDYIVEGMRDAEEGKPPARFNRSWQGQCYASGWNAWHDSRQGLVLDVHKDCDLEKWNDPIPKKVVIHPALMHIKFLWIKVNNMIGIPNREKAMKYAYKAQKLEKKWAKRGVTF